MVGFPVPRLDYNYSIQPFVLNSCIYIYVYTNILSNQVNTLFKWIYIRTVSIFSTSAGFDLVSEYFEKQRPEVFFGRKGGGSGVMVTCQGWTISVEFDGYTVTVYISQDIRDYHHPFWYSL